MRRTLTWSQEGAIRRTMRPLVNIFIGIIMLLSLAVGGVAHAAEEVCLPSVEASAIGHLDGDGDQAPHGGKEYAHHHGGCHGHHNVAAVEDNTLMAKVAVREDILAFDTAIGAAAPPGANLRPPIA